MMTIEQKGTAAATQNKGIHQAPPTNGGICALSASTLAALIRRGEISAVAAVEAYIERLQAVNPALNALVVPRFAEARAEAAEIDRRRAAGQALGPLAGVPVTVKECLDLAGTPSTGGVPSRQRVHAKDDERHVARLRAAGAVVLGKTNVGQLLLMIETDNPLYGRTNHPQSAERSPGGSSGGEGALLAAGASALGLGTDLGGSVRVPAAFCGVVAIKPTTGRCDDLGRLSVPLGQRAIASQVGVLGRSVGDVTLGLEVINGGRQPAQDGSLTPAMALGDPAAVDVSRLRVACYDDDNTFAPAPAIRRAVAESADKLAARGATVTRWSPPDVSQAQELFFGVLAADGFAGARRALGRDKRDRRIALMEMAIRRTGLVRLLLGASGRRRLKTEVVASYGRTDTDHYWQLVERILDYRQRFAQALQGFDAILCPAVSLPAFRHGAVEELILGGAYTCLYNVLGWPAGVVPVARVRPGEESARPPSKDRMDRAATETERGSAGLPVAVQIAARPWREDLVLATMAALESNRGG